MKQYDIAILSGYFNPLHCGHLDMIRHAAKTAHEVCVIVNSDAQVKLKGSTPFMNERDRLEIVQSLRDVDAAFVSIDTDSTVARSLLLLGETNPNYKLVFCNGGDRNFETGVTVEEEICNKYCIAIEYGVGGNTKRESSSELIKRAVDWHAPKAWGVALGDIQRDGAVDETRFDERGMYKTKPSPYECEECGNYSCGTNICLKCGAIL